MFGGGDRLDSKADHDEKPVSSLVCTLAAKKSTSEKPDRLARCPVCHECFKHPSRLAYLEADQRKSERELERRTSLEAKSNTPATTAPEAEGNTQTGTAAEASSGPRKELYVSRKYLDRFLQSPAYEIICRIDYHGVNNMHKLRKEVSESYAMLDSIQGCCAELGIPETLDNVYVIDLCSGKSLTTAIGGALYPKGLFLAVDKLEPHFVPHFGQQANTEYLSHDVMTRPFFNLLEQKVQKVLRLEPDRVVILIGMHLCGHLSVRAIDLFHRIPLIRGMILSPCCLPKRYGIEIRPSVQDNDDTLAPTDVYGHWCNHLTEMIQKKGEAVATTNEQSSRPSESRVSMHRDRDMHTIKNCIIRTLR